MMIAISHRRDHRGSSLLFRGSFRPVGYTRNPKKGIIVHLAGPFCKETKKKGNNSFSQKTKKIKIIKGGEGENTYLV